MGVLWQESFFGKNPGSFIVFMAFRKVGSRCAQILASVQCISMKNIA